MIDRVTPLKAVPSTHASAAEALARPKVLRRPAHFSDAAPSTSVQPIALPEIAPRETRVPIPRAWQDDGRFAVVLLSIVVFTNLAVMAWLSHIRVTPAADATARVTPIGPAASVPAPTREVTVFSHPAMAPEPLAPEALAPAPAAMGPALPDARSTPGTDE